MASTMTLKDRLDIAAKDAEAAQEKITSGTLGREAFRQEVRNYTLAKFFLTEDEVRALGTEDILKLADESVENVHQPKLDRHQEGAFVPDAPARAERSLHARAVCRA